MTAPGFTTTASPLAPEATYLKKSAINYLIFVCIGYILYKHVSEIETVAFDTSPSRFILFSSLTTFLVCVSYYLSFLKLKTVTAAFTKCIDSKALMEVQVLGSVANILPVPGATMVKGAYLAKIVGWRAALTSQIFLMTMQIAISTLSLLPLLGTMPRYQGWMIILLLIAAFIAQATSAKFISLPAGAIFRIAALTFLELILQVAKFLFIGFLAVPNPLLTLAIYANFSGTVGMAIGLTPSGIGISETVGVLMNLDNKENAVLIGLLLITGRVFEWICVALYFFFIRPDPKRLLNKENAANN
jgi:hypothetical protein